MSTHRVYYVSCTGNVRAVCDMLENAFEQADESPLRLVDLTTHDYRDVPDVSRLRFLGLAAPVMAFSPMPLLQTFVEYLPEVVDSDGPFVYIVLSGALTPGNSFRGLVDDLRQKGYSVIGTHFVRGEDSWTCSRFPWLIWALNAPSQREKVGIEQFVSTMIEATKSDGTRRECEIPWRPWYVLLDFIAKRYHPERNPPPWPKTIGNSCSRCGTCQRVCPAGIITLEAGMNAPLIKQAGCLGCFACINHCPHDAIDTHFTKGRPRYRGPGTTSSSYLDEKTALGLFVVILVFSAIGVSLVVGWWG